ncbi:Immunoglobulin iota chain [Tupaia chinensis]|nr:Immunoglobulin iota chain [Tupaia chinensis]
MATGGRALRVCTMPWIPLLLLLLTLCTGCKTQPVVRQPPSVSSSLGTTIRLPCTLSNENEDLKRPPRFTGSKDVANNRGYLSISELRPEDEAMYYCSVGTQSFDKEKRWERERERGEEKEPVASGSQAPQDMHTLN